MALSQRVQRNQNEGSHRKKNQSKSAFQPEKKTRNVHLRACNQLLCSLIAHRGRQYEKLKQETPSFDAVGVGALPCELFYALTGGSTPRCELLYDIVTKLGVDGLCTALFSSCRRT